jgi:hypothetical protein
MAGWKTARQQSPGAGSGNRAAQRLMAIRISDGMTWHPCGPCHEEHETEEQKGLQLKEQTGAEATKLPGHNASQRTLDRRGRSLSTS